MYRTNPGLELGSRSGLGSKLILEKLQEQGIEVSYTVSDASHFLLEQAEKRLKGYPGVEFILLDLDRSLLESDIKSGSYDVILSLNALHRCKNLPFALQQLDCLLKKEGLLFTLELVKNHPLELLSSAILEKDTKGLQMTERSAIRPYWILILGKTNWKKIVSPAYFMPLIRKKRMHCMPIF